jgi:flavin-binding protein dodecin
LTWVNWPDSFGRFIARSLKQENEMSTVAKIIEVNASSGKGFEEAIQRGLSKVSKSVKNIRGAWVSEMKVCTEPDGKIKEWHVIMRVSFVVE